MLGAVTSDERSRIGSLLVVKFCCVAFEVAAISPCHSTSLFRGMFSFRSGYSDRENVNGDAASRFHRRPGAFTTSTLQCIMIVILSSAPEGPHC